MLLPRGVGPRGRAPPRVDREHVSPPVTVHVAEAQPVRHRATARRWQRITDRVPRPGRVAHAWAAPSTPSAAPRIHEQQVVATVAVHVHQQRRLARRGGMHDSTRPRAVAPLRVLVPVAGASGKVELHHVRPAVTVDVEREVQERVAVAAMDGERLHRAASRARRQLGASNQSAPAMRSASPSRSTSADGDAFRHEVVRRGHACGISPRPTAARPALRAAASSSRISMSRSRTAVAAIVSRAQTHDASARQRRAIDRRGPRAAARSRTPGPGRRSRRSRGRSTARCRGCVRARPLSARASMPPRASRSVPALASATLVRDPPAFRPPLSRRARTSTSARGRRTRCAAPGTAARSLRTTSPCTGHPTRFIRAAPLRCPRCRTPLRPSIRPASVRRRSASSRARQVAARVHARRRAASPRAAARRACLSLPTHARRPSS